VSSVVGLSVDIVTLGVKHLNLGNLHLKARHNADNVLATNTTTTKIQAHDVKSATLVMELQSIMIRG